MVLTSIPWFFSHQTCKSFVSGSFAVLNALNCRLHFPGPERTLEAYATWFAAVFASSALFWAWKAFSIQSETLREQQREVFLNSLNKVYQERLENAALWIAAEVQCLPSTEDIIKWADRSSTAQTKLTAYLGMVIARRDIKEITYLLNESKPMAEYMSIVREYEKLIRYHNLQILRTGSEADSAWTQILASFDKLVPLRRTLTPKISLQQSSAILLDGQLP